MGGSLDVAAIAAMSEDDFVALCSERPAIHRFPGAMAKRVRQVCQVLAEEYDGQAGNVWKDAETGARGEGLAGQAARLRSGQGRHLHRGAGQAAGRDPAGLARGGRQLRRAGSFRSVADIVDQDSLQKVRETKRAAKAATKAAAPA